MYDGCNPRCFKAPWLWGRANASVDNAEYFMSRLVLIAALGRRQEAQAAIADFQKAYRDPTVEGFRFLPYADPVVRVQFLNALREAGLPANSQLHVGEST